MANSLAPTDVYQIVNGLYRQATGMDDLTAVDTSTFVSVGEKLLRTGYENTLNAISIMCTRTIFAIRPYNAKLRLLVNSDLEYGAHVRKISYLSDGAEATQEWNTDLNPTNLQDGQSIDMYKIKMPKVVQYNYYGIKTLQKHITRKSDTLKAAFSNETEFANFIEGVMLEFMNDIESLNEAETRGVLVNAIAGLYQYGQGNANMQQDSRAVIDLVELLNEKHSTNYTRAQILADRELYRELLGLFVEQLNTLSDFFTDRSTVYHRTVSGESNLLRHTDKPDQRLLIYEPFLISAKANVLPEVFNDTLLEIGDHERITFWQSQSARSAINVSKGNGLATTGANAGNSVDFGNTSIPYVLGLLYDRDFMGVNYKLNETSATPMNSAGLYYNLFVHWTKNYWTDFTENAVLFVLGNGGA